MSTAAALIVGLALAGAAPPKLELTNARLTYGSPGPDRADGKVRPGDRVVLSFDIEGLPVGPTGEVKYALGTEVADAAGKPLFKRAPKDQETITSLGGSRVPAYAQVDVGLDQPAGDYKLTVTVKDPADGRTQSLSRTVTVLKKDFALVRLTASADAEGRCQAAVYGTGQSMFVTFGLVGFARDRSDKMQPHLVTELRILDDQGKPTTEKPFVGETRENVPANALGAPMQFLVSLNRPGKFTVELTAHDKIAGTKSTVSFPVTVLEPR